MHSTPHCDVFLHLRYVRLLGAMYMRLTGTSVDCYKYLEPLYNDYRKIKSQNRNGGESFRLCVLWNDCTCKMSPGFKWHHILSLFVSEFELQHVDEFIDELLHAERMCDIILPRLQVSLPPCMCSHPFSLT